MGVPVLKDGMLLGAGRVVDGDVCDLPLAPQQVGALPVDVHDGQRLVVLERVQPPPPLGDARLGGLVVLDDYPPEGVGVLRQRPRQPEVGLLLVGRRVVAALAPLLGHPEGPAAPLLPFLLLLALLLLPVFPSALVVLLAFLLLLLEGLAVSLPMPLGPPALPLPRRGRLRRSVRLPPAPPLGWGVATATVVITTTTTTTTTASLWLSLLSEKSTKNIEY